MGAADMTQQSGRIWVMGGRPLNGTAAIPAAKNSVLPLLAAALLCRGPVRLRAVPRLSDVECSLGLLRGAGCAAHWQGADIVVAGMPSNSTLPGETAAQMRASILFCAPLLARLGRAETSLPGGCNIGARPIDQTIKGMTTLGAKVDTLGGVINASADRLYGADIFLDMPSVGATVNSMLTAVSAEGYTQIHNAAKEPHIVDLANFLSAMGASVRGAGTDVIRIRGGRHLHGTNYAIIPDQIETGTLMIAAAATGGDVTITGAIPSHMESLSAKLLEMGVSVYCEDDLIRVRSGGSFRSVNVKTQGYPGFPTDLQQPLSTLLTVARGTSIVTETIFESRFRFMDELRRMGASIRVIETTAIITGVDQLVGARVNATDLRAGAAMVVAGLMASGVTDIGGVDYILRGYEKIDQKLNSLGAQIELIDV